MDTARYVEKIATLFANIMASMELGGEAEAIGLTSSQVQGLSYLLHHGESSVGEIAEGLRISHPAAVRLVDRLRKKQLVQRTESKVDRRVSLIELTELGRELLGKIASKRTEVLSLALSKMQQDDLEGVMRGLETLLSAVLEESKTIKSACLHCGDDHIGCCVVNRTHLELTGTMIEKR